MNASSSAKPKLGEPSHRRPGVNHVPVYFVNKVPSTLKGSAPRARKGLLDEKRLEMAARNRSIKAKDGESVGKLANGFSS